MEAATRPGKASDTPRQVVQTIESLADSLEAYLERDQINAVRRAYYYAEQAHDGQLRRSGEPYVTLSPSPLSWQRYAWTTKA
jgi:(p)ppGpp synthase/HD superfamily hydrolase